MEKQKNAVGRRKEAVTRVFLNRGEGKIIVNDKDYKSYFQWFLAIAFVLLMMEFFLPERKFKAA